MNKDKEVIERIEEELAMITDTKDGKSFCPDNCKHIDAHAHKAGLQQILSLLKCQTCGGSGFMQTFDQASQTADAEPCPDCQPEPSGEFDKELREDAARPNKGFATMQRLAKAAALIEQLEAEKEALIRKMRIHAGDICSANNEAEQFILANQELEAENEQLTERIKELEVINKELANEAIAKVSANLNLHKRIWQLTEQIKELEAKD